MTQLIVAHSHRPKARKPASGKALKLANVKGSKPFAEDGDLDHLAKPFHALYQVPSGIIAGLAFQNIMPVAASLGLGATDLAERIGISRSTFHRRRKAAKTRLSLLESDALARYGLLVEKATETFDGDADAARQWLSTAQSGLGNAIPMEIARTTPGFREVEKLLTRIDHGVYA